MSTLNQPTASSPASSAHELEAILEAAALLGAEKIRQQASGLEERARAQRFYVACLGQFKRGKSTLLDALIGLPVLPTGILPVTAVPTVVRYGSAPAARIQLQPGEWKEIQAAELGDYVAEEQNPGNSKGVAAVEVFIPSQLLASGMCLVDTPGLGSIFASNTEATRAFVPHVDAAILVTGADPPLSADELSLAAAVAAHVKDIIVVLNKADRVTEAERLMAKDFAQLIFYKHLGQKTGPILEISATEWLQSGKPTRDGAKLVRNLQELAASSGAALAQGAWERGMQRLRLELRSMICERLGALTRPLEESRERLAALRERVEMAKSSLRDLAPLLTAEQQKMANIFAERRTAFMAATLPLAHEELQQQIARIEFRSGPKYRRDLMRLAQDTARRAVLPWLEKEQTNAADLYSKTMVRFTALAQGFVASFDKSLEGIEEAQLSSVFQYGEELTSKPEFRFYDMIRVARPVSPFGLLRDFVLCVMRVRQPFIRDAERFLEQLLEVNSWRVENDFKERVASSRQGLEKHIRSLLNEMVDRVESAVLAAQETINRGESAVETGIDRLRYMEQRLLAKASA